MKIIKILRKLVPSLDKQQIIFILINHLTVVDILKIVTAIQKSEVVNCSRFRVYDDEQKCSNL